MSFEICYTGEATTYMVAGPTPENKGDIGDEIWNPDWDFENNNCFF